MRTDNGRLRSELESLSSEAVTLREKLQAAEAEAKDGASTASELRTDNGRLRSELESLSSEAVTLREKLQAAEAEAKDGASTASELRTDNGRLRSELESLGSQLVAVGSELAVARTELDAARKSEADLTQLLAASQQACEGERAASELNAHAAQLAEGGKAAAIREVVALRAQMRLQGSPVLTLQPPRPEEAEAVAAKWAAGEREASRRMRAMTEEEAAAAGLSVAAAEAVAETVAGAVQRYPPPQTYAGARVPLPTPSPPAVAPPYKQLRDEIDEAAAVSAPSNAYVRSAQERRAEEQVVAAAAAAREAAARSAGGEKAATRRDVGGRNVTRTPLPMAAPALPTLSSDEEDGASARTGGYLPIYTSPTWHADSREPSPMGAGGACRRDGVPSGFCTSYIDVSCGGVASAAAAASRHSPSLTYGTAPASHSVLAPADAADFADRAPPSATRHSAEQARHTALLAAVQGSVLAELLESAREAFAFWHFVISMLPEVSK